MNGGGEAVICRVAVGGSESDTTVPFPPLAFAATADGAGENGRRITVDSTVGGLGATEFQIAVTESDGATADLAATTVSWDPDEPNYVNNILALNGIPVRAQEPVPATAPGGPTDVVLANGDASTPASAELVIVAAQATFTAVSVGDWGDNLRVTIDYATKDPADTDLFNVFVTEVDADGNLVAQEQFLNLNATSGTSRFCEDVVNEQSALVNMDLAVSGTRPDETVTDTAKDLWNSVNSLQLGGGDNGTDVTDGAIQTALGDAGVLDQTDLFNLLVIPPLTLAAGDNLALATHDAASTLCFKRNALYIADSPDSWDAPADPLDGATGLTTQITRHKNAAMFFPRLQMADALREGRPRTFGPAASIAGLVARTDSSRGFWKAPAGLEATLRGVTGLSVGMTDMQQGKLNQTGLNVIRNFPAVGTVSWGSRTLVGADVLADEWKYLPVRRVALHIKESLYRGTKWAVFEPNDERLWSQLRLAVGTFMNNLYRQGAFHGTTPREAYFVKCDAESTTQADIDLGIVNIVVGFKPVKPAEFVIIRLQQIAGESAA